MEDYENTELTEFDEDNISEINSNKDSDIEIEDDIDTTDKIDDDEEDEQEVDEQVNDQEDEEEFESEKEEDEDEEDEDLTDEKNLTDEISEKKPPIYSSTFILNNDLELNDSDEFLQKFGIEQKTDYINNSHQECLSKNYDEIKQLVKVIKDKNNIIIDELHTTIPILTKYEKTRILGIRLKQLNSGSKPYVNVSENILDNYLIANKELNEKKLPFIIQRPLPNNTFEYWKIQDLEIL
tara:strand:+ start:467 stop:1180 length:714 start_codon:yes stop_codon:yes gene_type:complete